MNDIYTLAKSIESSKEDIRQSIINKKVNVDINEPLSAYADKISQIRLASDYSDVVSIDAINYTGQEIKKGDKVWIVPNTTTNQTEINDYGSASSGYYISRDGQKIIGYKGIVYTDTKTVLDGYNNTSEIHFVWGEDDIYGYNIVAQYLGGTSSSLYNYSLLKNNGYQTRDAYIYEDIYMQNDTTNRKRQILINNKQDKIDITLQGQLTYPSYSYLCYDRVHSILFLVGNLSGSSECICGYKLDKVNKTLTFLSNNYSVLSSNNNHSLFACTSDGKYQFYYLSGQYASSISATSYDAANNKFSLPDYEKMNSDFPNLFERSNTFARYNQIDDVLYILDYNGASSSKPFYGYAYKYDTNTQIFYLLNKVEFPKGAYYSSSSTYITGSADGKILVQYNKWSKSSESAYKYKAVSTLYNNSGALSGIAEENATTNQSFKVGVALGPQTSLTVTTNIDNATLTVE